MKMIGVDCGPARLPLQSLGAAAEKASRRPEEGRILRLRLPGLSCLRAALFPRMSLSAVPFRVARDRAPVSCLAALNYLDRQALSVLSPQLRENFGYSTVQYSYVLTSLLVALGPGLLFLRRGRGRPLGRAPGGGRGAGRLVAGGIEPCLCFRLGRFGGVPICAGTLGESLHHSLRRQSDCRMGAVSRERGLSMALFSVGNLVAGSVLAPPLVAFTSIRFGWQSGFYGHGGNGIRLSALWFGILPFSQRGRGRGCRLFRAPRVRCGDQADSRVASGLCPSPLPVVFHRSIADGFDFVLSSRSGCRSTSMPRGDSLLAMIGIFGWIPFLAGAIGAARAGARFPIG